MRVGDHQDSISTQREVPEWFQDAKLGIFIHWGLFSVPAWAENGLDFGNLKHEDNNQDQESKWNNWFAHNAYAEWYFNTIRIEGSSAQQHHYETYGKNFSYSDFVPMFNDALKEWDPNAMASLFKEVNAKYVVLVSKHHDGFLMWPSETKNPRKDNYYSQRDIVGELGTAVRQKGMKMGYYYSGGLDWTFNDGLILKRGGSRADCDQPKEYISYADTHWRELIDKYETSILWNDICFAYDVNSNDKEQESVVENLHSHFLNKEKEGIINNRFYQYRKDRTPVNPNLHHDIITPEYKSFSTIQKNKWESCRGIGHSFGYNQLEGPDEYLQPDELVRSFVDIVSKNGNLLLNVGPMANGTIPPIQTERLRGLGTWLDANGEAIFGTRPWVRAAGETDVLDVDVRFTHKNDFLYVTIMATPPQQVLIVKDLEIPEKSKITLLSEDVECKWEQVKDGIAITFPEILHGAPAYSIKITHMPVKHS